MAPWKLSLREEKSGSASSSIGKRGRGGPRTSPEPGMGQGLIGQPLTDTIGNCMTDYHPLVG